MVLVIVLLIPNTFKIDYHACCNYFRFTVWILQLASEYLTNFFGQWIVSVRTINIATFCFKENQFTCHLGAHGCVIHTVHCICTTKRCRILKFWWTRGHGQKTSLPLPIILLIRNKMLLKEMLLRGPESITLGVATLILT